MSDDTHEEIVETLIEKDITISIAESCTGGLLSSMITSVPGASKILWGSIVAYSNEAKIDILGVDKGIIEKHGAVSSQTAEAMAERIREIGNTDYGVAITGIAGPEGGTEEKPVGLVYISLATNETTTVEEHKFEGGRSQVQKSAAERALLLLLLKEM